MDNHLELWNEASAKIKDSLDAQKESDRVSRLLMSGSLYKLSVNWPVMKERVYHALGTSCLLFPTMGLAFRLCRQLRISFLLKDDPFSVSMTFLVAWLLSGSGANLSMKYGVVNHLLDTPASTLFVRHSAWCVVSGVAVPFLIMPFPLTLAFLSSTGHFNHAGLNLIDQFKFTTSCSKRALSKMKIVLPLGLLGVVLASGVGVAMEKQFVKIVNKNLNEDDEFYENMLEKMRYVKPPRSWRIGKISDRGQ